MTDEVAGLLAEIVARPDDDGVRAVLADLLQAAGDDPASPSRGELISLQLLASRGNRDRDDRIDELLATHGRDWLGGLQAIAHRCQFDRGFPSRLELRDPGDITDAQWDAVLADPAIATIEALVPGTVRGQIYKRVATGRALVNLAAIEVYDRGSLEALEETAAPIEHLATSSFNTDSTYRFQDGIRGEDADGEAEAGYDERLWSAVANRTGITSLAIPLEQLAPIASQRWFERIEALTLAMGRPHRGLALWEQLSVRRLTLTTSPGLEPCERRFPWDYKIELIRDGRTETARISGEWILTQVHALEALPASVTRVELERTSDLIAGRIREVVERPGREVVEVPVRANNFALQIR